MIISLKRWAQMASDLWAEVLMDELHAEALQDNALWDEVQHPRGTP